MNERERWVVYPLLFLALGASLRDKLFDQTTTKSIVCQELTVVDQEPVGNKPVRVLAKIGRADSTNGGPSGGYLIVNGHLEVTGAVNARQYAFNGVPFVPTIPSGVLGVSWPDLVRAMQQAAQSKQQGNAPDDGKLPQDAPSDTESPPAEPLADPPANR